MTNTRKKTNLSPAEVVLSVTAATNIVLAMVGLILLALALSWVAST